MRISKQVYKSHVTKRSKLIGFNIFVKPGFKIVCNQFCGGTEFKYDFEKANISNIRELFL